MERREWIAGTSQDKPGHDEERARITLRWFIHECGNARPILCSEQCYN
jgi:hypothetical protein